MARRPALSPAAVRAADPRPVLRRAAVSLQIGAEVRTVLPQAPRRPSPEDLLFLARVLAQDAARAEFVREGLDAIAVPEGFSRADLAAADLLADRDYLAFMDRTLAVLDVRADAPSAREARAVTLSPSSADAHGFTLEATSTLASYLVDAAARLQGVPDRLADREIFAETQQRLLRDGARETLSALVTAPQELRWAMASRRRIAEGAADAATGGPAQAADGAGTGAPGAAGAAPGGESIRIPRSSRAEQTRPRQGGAAGGTGPTGRERKERERWRPSDVRRVLDLADSARGVADSAKGFLETEQGRAALDLLKKGSAAVAERAARTSGASATSTGSGTGTSSSTGDSTGSGTGSTSSGAGADSTGSTGGS